MAAAPKDARRLAADSLTFRNKKEHHEHHHKEHKSNEKRLVRDDILDLDHPERAIKIATTKADRTQIQITAVSVMIIGSAMSFLMRRKESV